MTSLVLQVRPLPGFYEPFSALTHLAAAGVFAWLGIALLRRATPHAGRGWLLACFVVTSVVLLVASGLFHMLPVGTPGRGVLRAIDLAVIFALIAGTLTPVQGIFFHGFARWFVISVVWILAITGIVLFSVFAGSLPRGTGTVVYLGLGGIASITAWVVWRRRMAKKGALLLIGVLVYAAGAILLGRGWPQVMPQVIGPHEVWHLAVITALAFHLRFFQANVHHKAMREPVLESADTTHG